MTPLFSNDPDDVTTEEILDWCDEVDMIAAAEACSFERLERKATSRLSLAPEAQREEDAHDA